MQKKLLAIDGNSLMHRAFWALPEMKDRAGHSTNAVYGFFTMLFRMIEELQPTHVAVAFDKSAKTFRHEWFGEYKAGRKKTPPELSEQFPMIRDCLKRCGVPILELETYEADDILGTLAMLPDMQKYIVTGDKDALQLISDDTTVMLTKKGVTDLQAYDQHALFERYSLKPEQIVDLKALMGDASDNIPGVAGVGEKTAVKLLVQYGTLENLYDSMDELPKNKLREKLERDKEHAFLSYKLAKIYTEVPLSLKPEQLAFAGFDLHGLREVCEEHDFNAFLKRFSLEKTLEEVKSVPLTLEELPALLAKKPFALYLDDAVHVALEEHTDYVLTLRQTLIDEGYDLSEVLEALRPFINQPVTVYDAKHWMHVFHGGFADVFDCMIAQWVLNPSLSKYEFMRLCEKEALPACAASLLILKQRQRAALQQTKTEYIYDEIELPLIRVLFEMEQEGFCVSAEQLRVLQEEYEKKISALTRDIYDYAGETFNIQSTKQLGKVLFEDLKLPVVKKTKTGYSTDIAVLEKLSGIHPIIDCIIEYRQITKLKSTYVDGLLAVIQEGRVHTTFLQTATATGRLSSVEPNLQNIPVRSEMAQDIRKAFVAPSGYTIVAADYSQIELRILAHIADDAHLKDAFIKQQDIHARTASEILNKPIDEVTPQERSNAKAVNFGIVYGISDFGLARNTGISRAKAKQYIEKYFAEFSGVKNYMDDIIRRAHRDGYVRTLWGRIRYIPELANSNYNMRSFGERAALNTPVQGSAADIIKIAMIRVAKALEGMKSSLVLQVHDELIVYAHNSEIEAVKEILAENMGRAAELSVPLTVHIAQGACWAEAK